MTDNKTHIRKINFNVILADFMQNYDYFAKLRLYQYHMHGSRGLGGEGICTPPPPQNHKWLKIFLEILVRIPSRSNCFWRAVHTTLYEKILRQDLHPTPTVFSGSAHGISQ